MMQTMGAGAATLDWNGIARDERADGWVVERSWTAVPRRWRAVITDPDRMRWELYTTDYERLIVWANEFVEGVKAQREAEAALAMLGAA